MVSRGGVRQRCAVNFTHIAERLLASAVLLAACVLAWLSVTCIAQGETTEAERKAFAKAVEKATADRVKHLQRDVANQMKREKKQRNFTALKAARDELGKIAAGCYVVPKVSFFSSNVIGAPTALSGDLDSISGDGFAVVKVHVATFVPSAGTTESRFMTRGPGTLEDHIMKVELLGTKADGVDKGTSLRLPTIIHVIGTGASGIMVEPIEPRDITKALPAKFKRPL